jgi:hypothetical protein
MKRIVQQGAVAIPIFQFMYVAVIVAAIGTLVALVQRRWKRSAIWLGALIVTTTLAVLLLQSWNRVMTKVDADDRAHEASP